MWGFGTEAHDDGSRARFRGSLRRAVGRQRSGGRAQGLLHFPLSRREFPRHVPRCQRRCRVMCLGTLRPRRVPQRSLEVAREQPRLRRGASLLGRGARGTMLVRRKQGPGLCCRCPAVLVWTPEARDAGRVQGGCCSSIGSPRQARRACRVRQGHRRRAVVALPGAQRDVCSSCWESQVQGHPQSALPCSLQRRQPHLEPTGDRRRPHANRELEGRFEYSANAGALEASASDIAEAAAGSSGGRQVDVAHSLRHDVRSGCWRADPEA
mmetsp:Transcript_84749/g.197082  ORF Transcript_84749/g.197082 Transcript_84749/m.197082 type:complete len:267 (-) Transcript_84749:564-1364(-)